MRLQRSVWLALALCLALPFSVGEAALPQGGGLSDSKIIAGLKEALEVGTGNAVNLTGRVDGFFANAAIKILLPRQQIGRAHV